MYTALEHCHKCARETTHNNGKCSVCEADATAKAKEERRKAFLSRILTSSKELKPEALAEVIFELSEQLNGRRVAADL